MKRETFARGATILFLTGLGNRALGFLHRILIIRLFGAEVMGLYEMVFPFYSLILVISTAGLPVALAKFVAEKTAVGQYAQARGAFRATAALLGLNGLISAIAVGLTSPLLAQHVLPDPRVYPSLLMTLPALLVVPACSGFRALFQGIGLISRPALSQSIEQVVRITSGLWLASRLRGQGSELAATGLTAGMALGEIAGLVYLLVCYCRLKPPLTTAAYPIASDRMLIGEEFWRLGLPVTVTRILAALTLTLEAILIPQRLLAAGYPVSQATQLYGQFSGISMALLYLPAVFTFSLASTMVPAVAEAFARRQAALATHRIRDALRLTAVAGTPFTVAYLLFPVPITHTVFASPEAGETLKILASAGPLIYLQQTTNGVLHGLGRADLALRNSTFSTAAALAGICWLTGVPAYGIKGTAFSVAASGALAGYLNLRDVARLTGAAVPVRSVLAMTVSALVMAATTVRLYGALEGRVEPLLALGSTLAVGLVVYLSSCLLTGALSRRDLTRLWGLPR